MSLENWQILSVLAKERLKKNVYSTAWRPSKFTRKTCLISALLLAIVTAFPLISNGFSANQYPISSSIARVTMASGAVNTVYVNPGSVPLQAVGSSFTVQVKVANMAQFNGWDIQIVTGVRPYVVNATSLSISGNIFAVNTTGGSPFEIVHCVNGVGTGCTSSDGPGIVHSAFGDTAFTSGSGLLFTITYTIIGSSIYNPLTVQNSLISSSSPTGVPHSDQSAFYGILPPLGGGGTGKRMAT